MNKTNDMKNIINNFEKEQIRRLTAKKNIPNFRAGDTIRVNVKVVEGERSRIQVFEGVCIARKNSGLNSSLTVRKISYGEGIERIFPFFSNIVDSIKIIRQGNVRRAKLYYLRNLSGKRTRIADKNRGEEVDLYSITDKQDKEISSDSNNNDEVKEENLNQGNNMELAKEENNESKKSQQKPAKNKSTKNGEELKK